MLSTVLSTAIFFVVALSALILAIFSYRKALACAEYAASAVAYVEKQNKQSISLRKMADVEAQLTDLTDSYDSLLTSHKKLRARIGMRAAREKKANGVGLSPNGLSDIEKSELKKQLRMKHILNRG